jgi:ParB family transcriptional regulator, chromosome partitioning protein
MPLAQPNLATGLVGLRQAFLKESVMTIPTGFPYPLNQVVEIPLEQIIPNPDQPRRSMRQEPLETLAASMKAKGQLTEAKVRPLTEAERVSNPGVWVMLVGGHRRRLAALRNGFKTLKCTVHDITPEDTHYQALMDNDHEAMDWWDWDIAIEKESQTFPGTLEDLGTRLDKGMTKVYGALKIGKALNPVARALVDENLEKTLKNDLRTPKVKNKAFSITESHLLVLADLEDPDRVLEALQVVLDDYLTTDQAQRLVEHMQAGEPVETFSPHKPVPPKPKAVHTASHPDTPPELSKHPTHHPSESHANGHSEPSPFGETLAQSNHGSLADSSSESAEHNRGPQPIASAKGHASQMPHPSETSSPNSAVSVKEDLKPSFFWEWMLGIKFFSQLKSKYKKGEPLTLNEKMLVGLYRLYDWVLKPIGKHLGRFFKWAGKGIWNSLKKAFGKIFGKTVEVLLPWVLLIGLVWGILAFFHFAVVSPWHWVEHKIGSMFHHEDITPEQTPVPQPVTSSLLPQIQAVIHKAPEKKIEKTAPPITYQPAVSFNTASSPSAPAQTLYDPKILESEILSLPQNCVVKDYPMTPDEGMPVDVAVSRMQDLIDPDKYTLMIGGSKQIMTSVNPTSTTLTIDYKGADLFNVLGGGNGPIHFLWEDVKYIHANEIDVETNTPSVIYQCSLVVSGSKIPLTLQCASAADLEHLVSTMQYFIRNSRLGHDTALAGMPYRLQGLVLADENQVQKLWADSPAGRAGVNLGDHLWSVGFITPKQQERKDLEAGLSSLPVTLFTASAPVWDKALIAFHAPGQGNPFKPKLRKVVLAIY